MDIHAIASSLREAMYKMNDDLPDLSGNAWRRILVRALRVEEAPSVLCAINMRANKTWQVHNLNAVRQMANAYLLLRILDLAAFPARVEQPHDDAGGLVWIRDCEEQLRECAEAVGGSFRDEAIPLFDKTRHHVNASEHQSFKWIVRDAKALLKLVTKLCKSAHTLSEAASP
ncbi:unnamed protein product [Urochloa humidicola]